MTTVKTTKAKGHKFPWNHLMPKHKIDPSKIKIKSDPLPEKRISTVGKYDKLIRAIKPGQNFECPPEAVASLSAALRKYLEREGKLDDLKIVMQTRGPDGLGRVWLVSNKG